MSLAMVAPSVKSLQTSELQFAKTKSKKEQESVGRTLCADDKFIGRRIPGYRLVEPGVVVKGDIGDLRLTAA